MVLINGLIMATIGTLSILLSEPTAKSNLKKDMYVCPLTCNITLHIVLNITFQMMVFVIANNCSLNVIVGRLFILFPWIG